MSGRLVGVDVGSTAVRAVEVAGVDSDGFAVISKIGISLLPDGAVVAGRIRSPKDVAIALTRALREAGVPRQGFILGLTSPDVAVTTMAFPVSVRQSERDGAIRALGRAVSPTFGMEESSLATYLIGASGDANGMSTIGVAAALAEDVAMLRAACDTARCAPRAIDLSGAALLRALTRVNPLTGEIGSIVDIGATKITVATRQGMYLRSLRTTVGAGSDLTRAIAGVTHETFAEAEERKYAMRLSSGGVRTGGASAGYGAEDGLSVLSQEGTSIVDMTLSSAVDVLVDTIAQSVETDAGNFGSLTQGVSLCGGTALLRGVKDRLQLRLGVPVSIGRPWADIERSRKNARFFVEGRPDPRVLLSLAAATGLALWKEPA